MKYYETKNTHEAYNETEGTNNKLHRMIWNAWKTCEDVDYMVEWDERNFAEILEVLRNDGKGDLADELEAEAIKYYGDTVETMLEDVDPYGWDY